VSPSGRNDDPPSVLASRGIGKHQPDQESPGGAVQVAVGQIADGVTQLGCSPWWPAAADHGADVVRISAMAINE